MLCTGITDGLGLSGIGKICEAGPEHVIFMARNPKKADNVKALIESKAIKCTVLKADSSKPKEIIAAAREVEKATDQLHCIWNNAGIWTTATEVQRPPLWTLRSASDCTRPRRRSSWTCRGSTGRR